MRQADTLLSLLQRQPLPAEALAGLVPELRPMFGFDQHNEHHSHDVWTHTALAVAHCPRDPVLQLAALFHDMGKPDCFFLDESGVGHFYGHARISADKAEAVLTRLGFDADTRRRVCLLVKRHDMEIKPEYKYVRRAMLRLTPEVFFQLLQLKRADNLAQNPAYHYRQETYYDRVEQLARDILEDRL